MMLLQQKQDGDAVANTPLPHKGLLQLRSFLWQY